jgi:hypothetical protein
MSKAKSEQEVRDELFRKLNDIAVYWANLRGKSDLEKCRGVVFSILNIFDGTSIGLPAMDIRLSPHPDDKQYHIDLDEDYYEEGVLINDCYLHHLWQKALTD